MMDKLKFIFLMAVLLIFVVVMVFALGLGNFQSQLGSLLGMIVFAVIIIAFFFLFLLKVVAKM
jgi:hypothetical protein